MLKDFHLNEEQDSNIVIRHAEPKDIDAIRQLTPSRRCLTTRYRSLIHPTSVAAATDTPA